MLINVTTLTPLFQMEIDFLVVNNEITIVSGGNIIKYNYKK